MGESEGKIGIREWKNVPIELPVRFQTAPHYNTLRDHRRSLEVRGPGFDSRFYRGDFSLKRKIPIVTTDWAV
jgi:hypothetical protein